MSIRLSSLVVLPVLLSASVTAASPLDGRVRLGFDLAPLTHTSTTVSFEDTDDGFPGPDDVENSQLSIGIGTTLGVQVGYALSEHLVLGTRVLITSVESENDTTDEFGEPDTTRTITTNTIFLPYLAYVGGTEDSTIRFTVGASLGYAGGGVKQGSYEQSTSGFALGANIGFLAFAADRFSIDPSVFVLYESGTSEVDFGDDFSDSGVDKSDYKSTIIGVSVAFSGWVGGASEPPPERERADYGLTQPSSNTVAWAPPPPPPAPKTGLVSTRATIDSAVVMLLGSPEQRGSSTALRIQRYAPAGEPVCDTLVIENDGVVAATLPLQQSVTDQEGIQQVTVQAITELEVAEAIVRARTTKLRWCDNERTLSRAARDGIAEFVATMRARVAAAPAPQPATTPTAPVEGAAPATPATTTTPSPATPATPAAPSASPYE